MAMRLFALRINQPLFTPRKINENSVRGCDDPKTIVRLEGLHQLKKTNYLIGTQTNGIVPQPTVIYLFCIYTHLIMVS
jgi:hypothetical protein